MDLELVVRGTDGQNLRRVAIITACSLIGFWDGFVVDKFAEFFSLFSLPILEPHFSTLLNCLGCGIVSPHLHLQFLTDQIGDYTIMLTEELKVDNIRAVERIHGGLVFLEQVLDIAEGFEVQSVGGRPLPLSRAKLDALQHVDLESDLNVEHPWLLLALKELESWSSERRNDGSNFGGQ